jgi:hypothetical protein
MQHVFVQRVAATLALILAAAAGLFAWGAGRQATNVGGEPDAPTAARAFAEHCARCHAESDLAQELRSHEDPAARVLELLEFLASHGNASEREDRAIVGDLLQRSRAR